MKRPWALVFLMAMASSAIADNIDYRALLLRFFTTNIPSAKYVGLNTNTVVTFGSIDTNYLSTNGFVIQINTNLNSSFYQFITNSIIQNASPQVWTNGPPGDVKLTTYTTHDTVLVGSNAPLVYHANSILTLIHDQAIGESDNPRLLLESYGDLVANGMGDSQVKAFHDFDCSSSSNAPFVGYQLGYTDTNGASEYFDFFADGDVFSQFLFSTSIGSPLDSNPMVISPNFTGTGITPATAYKFGTSKTVTAGHIVDFLNAGTSKFAISNDAVLYWGADATIGYRPPSTNALPGQVWASSGGTPQQLYWTNLPAGGGGTAQDLWRTNPVEGGIWWSNAPQVAKFGSYTSGFVAGQTNSGGTVEAQFGFGAIGLGYATGSGSLITSEGNGSLTYGETSAGGLIEGDGNGSTAAGYSTGSGSTINSIADGSFAGGKADLGGKVLAENTATASMVYGYSSAGLLRCLGSSTFLFGEADGAGSVMDNNGLGTLMVGRANHGGTFLAHGSGGITSGYVDFGGNLDDGGALGSIANAFVTGTNSKSFNYPYGSLFTSAVREAGDVLFGINQVVYQEGCLGAVAVNSAGVVRMNPAVGCFIGGLATSTNLLSANGTNTFTFGENVGNSGNYAYSFGSNYTNSQDRSFNVGWFTTQSLNILTNKIQEAIDTGGRISPRRVVAKPVTLTTNSATAICTITLPTSLATLGAKVYATTKIKNATDWGYVTEELVWGAGNKAGTVTTKVAAPAQTCSDGTGGASVVTTWTATVSGTTITLKNKAVTSGIAATTTTCLWRIETDADDAIVITPQ